jgi:integrase
VRDRLRLPEDIRLHDLRSSYVTNALDARENPVEVSANVRHHSPGSTMARYGKRREEGARKLAASGAGRVGLARLV